MSKITILIILPHEKFRDKEYSTIKEKLDLSKISFQVASSNLSVANGAEGLQVSPDITTDIVDFTHYDGFIFIGEEAASEYETNRRIMNLLDHAFIHHKLVAAIGFAVELVTKSRHIDSLKITGRSSKRKELENSGAFFTGSKVEQDHNLITASGPYEVNEFADRIVSFLTDSKDKTGREYLR